MAQHVFISYAHEDDTFAQKLKQQIENAGFDHWIDREQLKGSQNWVEECKKAIDDSYALIVIKSPDSYDSPYVTCEWSYALGRDVPVIPILYKPQNPHHAWLELNAIHHLDFTDPTKPLWDDLFRHLDDQRKQFGIRVRVPKDAPPAVRAALRELNSEFPSDVIKGAARLGNLKHEGAVPGLVITLGHEDNDVRNAAMEALVKTGEPAVAQLLNDFLIYEGNTCWMIANALSQIKSEAAFQGLLDALQDTRVDARKAAIQYLRNFKDARAIKPLGSALHDEDKDIRITVVGTLIEIGDGEGVPYLLEALQDKDTDVRSTAAGVWE